MPLPDTDRFLTDSKGNTLSYKEAYERARKYILKWNRIDDIVDDYLVNTFSDELQVWVVDPDTGEFVDDD